MSKVGGFPFVSPFLSLSLIIYVLLHILTVFPFATAMILWAWWVEDTKITGAMI